MTRTRFAPSPTGYLHIGGARTALYCWLFAKKTQGTFILRIEDTDIERSTEASVQAILESMSWLNLDYHEGPYYQTKRFSRYHEVTQLLLAKNQAYRCYCSKERLEALREEQLSRKEKPRYDHHCRELNKNTDEPHVIRFKNPLTGVVTFNDLIRGTLSFANEELDDLIIARSDGTPTYNFTVVVDDWDMQITHVIRGDDHINNTPRQINILSALGAIPPIYAHVPMILGGDGKRLSKRHGAVSVMQYREEGILREALLNYLVRLGWSHGDQEIFSREELVEYFAVEDINKAPAAFNQDKLLWLNQHYLKNIDPEVLAKELAWQMQRLNISFSPEPPLSEVVIAQRERVKTVKEMADKSRFFYERLPVPFELQSLLTADIVAALTDFRDKLAVLLIWTKEGIHEALVRVAERHQLKLGKIAQPLRLMVTGGAVSPSIDLTVQLIGQKEVILRINAALSTFAEKN